MQFEKTTNAKKVLHFFTKNFLNNFFGIDYPINFSTAPKIFSIFFSNPGTELSTTLLNTASL